MSMLIKVNVLEVENNDPFDLFFWGNDQTDALDLAASVCSQSKLVMLDYKIIKESETIPEPILSLGAGSVADVYSDLAGRLQVSKKVH